MHDTPRDDEAGEPIAELAEFATSPPPGFLDRVRSRIERRQIGSHVMFLSWHGAVAVFVEFLRFFFEPFGEKDKGGRS